MTKIVKLIMFLLASASFLGAHEDATKKFTTALDLGVFSEYNYRQETLEDDFVFQGTASIQTEQGISLGAWFNNSASPDFGSAAGNFSEVDLFASYGKTIGKGYGEFGITEFIFPDGSEGARELHALYSFDNDIASPYLSVHWDIDRIGGLYVESGVEKSVEGFDVSALVSYADADYNEAYHGEAESNLHGYSVGVARTFPLDNQKEGLSVTVSTNYAGLLSFGKDSGNFFGGVVFNLEI